MYRFLVTCIGLTFLWAFGPTANARNLTVEEKLADFHYLVTVINSGYGPLEYKMANKVVSYPQLNARFEQEIAQTTSNNEFYYKMLEYVASFRDGHFGMYLPSKKTLSVPVITDLVNDQVLITHIDRSRLKEDKFTFSIGDEIISVDGQPIAQYLDQMSRYIGSGSTRTVRRIASWSVFARNSSRLPLPEAKTVKVEIRRGTSNIIEAAELEWKSEGEDLIESSFQINGSSALIHSAETNFDRLNNQALDGYVHPDADPKFMCSGETLIDIPKDATIIMKSPFVAYYHPTAKGNVGYLRIPHYYPQAKPGQNETDVTLAWIENYRFAVRELEKNTVGLVIDQNHNCGGSVWVVHKLIGMFMDRPFKPSQFELLANKESLLDFQKWFNNVPEFTVDRANIQSVLDLVKSTWLKGNSRLTPKTSIDGVTEFDNDSIHYSKPIVMLIDEVSGSGGDMFPAMMKGLGRAKLFGQTTSGLGGHVQFYPASLPNSQLNFRMTKSLFYGPDGVAIENNGAVADRFYTPTRDDVLYGYKQYQKDYLSYLMTLLP